MRTTFAGIFSNDMAGIQVYNIRTYGAKVDGVTDDSAAVTAAINAAKATSGGIIFFPRGTATHCTGDNGSFGGNGGTFSSAGRAAYCRLTSNNFPTPAGGGIIVLCVNGSWSEVNEAP